MKNRAFPLARAIIVSMCALTLAVGACAPVPKDPHQLAAYKARNDPLEPLNRKIFKVNMAIERGVMRPMGKAYKRSVPSFIRDRIRDFSNNFESPVTFINDILQGKTGRAAETATRFIVNSTAGIGGLFDVAGQYGLKRHTEDFGQTLAVWGVPSGPYLVLPIMGPSSVRHTAGRVVDSFSNPLSYATPDGIVSRLIFGGRGVVSAFDQYSRNITIIENTEKNSVDFYSAVRSLYRQNRKSEIKDGKIKTKDIPLPSDDE